MNVFLSLFALSCWCVQNAWCAIGNSVISCESSSTQIVGATEENFEGDVEILTGILPTDRLILDEHFFQTHLAFLKLSYTPGETSATVQTAKPLDADILTETGGTLYYAVTCTNSRMKHTRTLPITDINDNPPIFESKLYNITVSEILTVGSDVLRIKAVDADVTSENNRVSYSMLTPVPGVFELRSDGNIRLIAPLNYNTARQYRLTVEAKDPGDLKDTAEVIIDVEDVDNLNPYFHHSLYEASIPENQVGPFPKVTPEAIKAQDGDTGINVPVFYNITTVTPNKYVNNFDIDTSSGVISVTAALDREEIEKITVQIKAAQVDDKTKTANAIVLLTVGDENDNPPEFDQTDYSAVIPENSPKDMFVFQAKVTDQDLGGFVGTLRIIPETAPFSVDPDGSMRVKTPADLDRETTPSFSFQIEAKEAPPSGHTTVANVNVTLSDENDNSPIFKSSKYEGSVSNDQFIGMLVVKVEATDQDEGLNGEISYFIDFGNEDGYFSIEGKTGEITLTKKIELRENEILKFPLYVTAKDGGAVSRSSSVLVDIKAPGGSRPQFLQKAYEGKVEEEKEAGTEIVKVTFLSVEPFVPVTLSVVTEGDKFDVDHVTGMLTTKVSLDYEVQKNYTVKVSLTDGTNSDEASVFVEVLDVNDNSPVFASSSVSIDVPENATIGSNVSSVSATDADSGLNAEIRYILEASAGMFSINPETGFITVAAALDRESVDKYNLRVFAQDQGRPPRSAEASVVVTVTDVNDNAPVFAQRQYEGSVPENATVAFKIVSVSATDKDEGANGDVTYYVTKQEPPSSPAAFNIDASSGIITLAQKLDYSKVKKYTLEVEARDGGSPQLTASTVVTLLVEDVNDKEPQFSKDRYDVSVYESLAPGSAVVSLEVTDEDADGFSNGHFLLTSDTFGINEKGVVYLQSTASLDRETKDNYILKVVAVDQPVNGLSSTAEVNVTVLDVNDNSPQFLPFQNPNEVVENQKGVFDRIQVTDLDIGENGEVTLSLSSYTDLFAITADGTLSVVGDVDRETQDAYDLIITATDHGFPPRSNISMIKVIVADENDNAPVFTQSSYSAIILSKDATKGAEVLTVSATDKDIGNNSLVAYRFSKDSDEVELDSETGVITWTLDLTNTTEEKALDLVVTAEDHGTPAQSSEVNVRIELQAVYLPDVVAFENSTYFFQVKENEQETTVGQVKASVSSQQVQLTYRLTTHTDRFAVDESGTLKTLKPLDKEEQEYYFIEVEAADSSTSPNTAVTTVVVQVEDVNEPPVFEKDQYRAEIFSVVPFRFPILTVKASDPDVGDTEELSYSLGKPSSELEVTNTSGQVYVLDVAGKGGTLITAQVKVTDKRGLSATAEIQVDVKDSASDNIVVISINHAVYTVEKKLLETQISLEKVLGWSVNIINVRAQDPSQMRSLLRQTTIRTYLSFIAVDKDGLTVSSKVVREKLQAERESVKAELEKVFGPGLELEEQGTGGSGNTESSNEAVVITLAVLFSLTTAALIVLVVVFVVNLKKSKQVEDDKQSLAFEQTRNYNDFIKDEFLAKEKNQEKYNSVKAASELSEKITTADKVSANDAKLTSSL